MRKAIYVLTAIFLIIGYYFLGYQSSAFAQDPLPASGDIVSLGRAIFFDTDLSANGRQSCAACHAAEVGFTGPDALVNAGGAIYPGAIPNHYRGLPEDALGRLFPKVANDLFGEGAQAPSPENNP